MKFREFVAWLTAPAPDNGYRDVRGCSACGQDHHVETAITINEFFLCPINGRRVEVRDSTEVTE